MGFNPGDIVECIRENQLLTEGKQYTVDAVHGDRVIIRGKYDDGSRPHSGEYLWRFKLVRTAAAEAKLRAFERDRIPARKTDPSTSQKAAKPKRTGLREQVLAAIAAAKSTGLTGHEAAQEIGLLRLNSITPRFAELRKAQKIKDSGQRRDGQIVWVLA